MPKYLYTGDSPCRVGTQNVNPGEVVESSFCPGKRFTRIQEAEELRLIGILERLSPQSPGYQEVRGESRDFTILSTGLLHEADFATMEYYSTIGPVVIQSWADQDYSKVPLDLPDLTVIKADPPKLPASITRDDLIRFSYQVLGVFLGLEQVHTKYTIRVRNDEHVSDLSALIELFLRDTRKIVSSSIFWGEPLQLGDHIFVAETDLLKKAYGLLCTQVATGVPLKERQPSPEYALLTAFVHASREKYPPTKNQEVILDRADIVHISRFGDYAVINHPEPSRTGGGTRRWTPANPCDYKMLSTSHQLADTIITPYTYSD